VLADAGDVIAFRWRRRGPADASRLRVRFSKDAWFRLPISARAAPRGKRGRGLRAQFPYGMSVGSADNPLTADSREKHSGRSRPADAHFRVTRRCRLQSRIKATGRGEG